MASLESPLNTAHQHAANADDYIAQGLLVPAAEEHYKAAEAFLACIELSKDENTKRTLRMLHNEHSKAGKDLQRKIAKLREENKDPNLPQKPTRSSSATNPAQVLPAQPAPPSPPQRNRMIDSQQTVDESFMILGQRSDAGDAFHQFWKITEGMLEHLSQPVAFATAPLGLELDPQSQNGRRREGSSSDDTDPEDIRPNRLSRGIGLVKAARSRMLARQDSDSDGGRTPGPSTFPPKPQPTYAVDLRDDWDDEVRAYDDDDMSDSFCLIPSGSEPVATTLKKENTELKMELDEMRKQLASAEATLKMRQEQDQHLRDSIMLARKEAHRVMVSSTTSPRQGQIPDLASLNINVPAVPPAVTALKPGRDREAQLLRRVRELEEEMRMVRAENEKQKAMIVRFRERWEKLKESAKRKKEAKVAAEMTPVASDRIEEEPEAEAEAEKDDLQPRKESETITSA
ncbi:hypothetical protein CERSUDRAFT_113788 [Gelatoporia subvermispora B]|uniref:Nuclear receptor-binding factor 2 MIT domain-containing protein n=1 Tax=Ceriporiopsis subvermispora (strain B) TaxID=914234 RepID=M2QNI4_CERS8|nr:hypothetical protein CERSUDRAFT_113788 [Gelatoporia subvermispora B]